MVFPSTLDAFNNPTSADNLNTPGVVHDVQHSQANDAIEALEAKVGVDGSAVTTSHDYKLARARRTEHTWSLPDSIAVAAGDTDYIVPFFISIAAGTAKKLAKVRYRCNSGTFTFKLQRRPSGGAAADIAGFGTTTSPLSCTTTSATTNPTDVDLDDDDELYLVVVATTSGKNGSVTVAVDEYV